MAKERVIDDSTLTAIADNIRVYLLTEDSYKPTEMPQAIEDVYYKGDSDGYVAGLYVGIDEGIEQGKQQYASEKMNLSMSLSSALLSGDDNIDPLEMNIEQAKSDITAIKTLIENHGVEVPVGTSSSTYDETIEQIITDEKAESVEAGIEQGKQSAYDKYWDEAQDCGNLTTYDCFFAGGGWTKNNAKPKYKIQPVSAYAMFDRSRVSPNPITTLEDLGVEVDFSQCTSMTGCFQNSNFTYISKVTSKDGSWANWGNCFTNCTSLEKIGEFKVSRHSINNSSANGIAFPSCTKLTDITMVGEIGTYFNAGVCPLNKASIISIIEHLSTRDGYTLTLKKTAVNEAFGIDVDDETTYPEGTEFYELRHSKDNWTFSYV